MPKVTIQPLNLTLEAEDGATIMDVAWAYGLYWPTTCGAQGICTSCACTIDEGAEDRGEAALRNGTLRLACQARVRGDVVVTKAGVRPARPSALSLDTTLD